MSYIGLDPQQKLLFTSTEFFSGDGSTIQFILARNVASASDLDVIVGNVAYQPIAEYTAQGLTLLFTTAPASGTDNIAVTYRGGALNTLTLSAEVFPAGTVGDPSVYSVASNNTGLYWANATTMSVAVSGVNNSNFNANLTSISYTSGALVVQGGAGFDGNVHANGELHALATTESTSVASGALLCAGGAGIAGNLNVGGDITCIGDFTVNGTFTTTGTDSLDVADPFIFLANSNPGDTYDSGVVSQYFTDQTRYTGYFRDVTDGKFKLFGNLVDKPTTTVNTLDPSFQYEDLILANLSATGNISGTYVLGNGAFLTGIQSDPTQIFNLNSKFIVPSANGNLIGNVNGVTMLVVSSLGISAAGNVQTTGWISTPGNITGGNLNTGGLISAAGNIAASGNLSGGNVLTGGLISAAGNITGGNLITGGLISAAGNLTAANISTGGLISAAGNITGGNLITGGLISAAGNITGGNIIAGDAFVGYLDVGNIAVSGNIAVESVTANLFVSAAGNVTGGNIRTAGQVSATGNITGNYILGNGALLTGIDAASIQNGNSNVRVAANSNVTVGISGTANLALFATTGLYVNGLISASGNITGGNLQTSGLISATGNITGGNLITSGLISSAGNVTGNYILGNAAFLSGLPATYGNANVAAYLPTYTGNLVSLTGPVTSTANVSGGNLIAGNAIIAGTTISAAGNAVVGNIAATNHTGTAVSVSGNIIGGNIISSTLSLSGNVLSALTSTSEFLTTANITGGNLISSGSISGTGNITGGNVLFGSGMISGTGNITGSNVIATKAFVGNLDVGNISVSGNIVVESVTANLFVSAAGNVTGGNLRTAGQVSATGNATVGNLITSGLISAGGNITGGNLLTAGLISAGGNITGGNLITSGLISAGGTITGAALNLGVGNITVGNIFSANGNGIGNIGNSSNYFNTGFIKATTAQYADLAEMYAADAAYEPGTVLRFGGTHEATLADTTGDTRIIGVVSTNPAHLMNSVITAEYPVPVALQGRVPTKVVGPVTKGDMMISAGNGHAKSSASPTIGSVIGKSLEDFSGNVGVIEIVVGRL